MHNYATYALKHCHDMQLVVYSMNVVQFRKFQSTKGISAMRIQKLAFLLGLLLSTVLPAYASSNTANHPSTSAASKSITAQKNDHRNFNDYTHGRKSNFHSLVSFGDSLSDVGTYAVGTIAALGGGQFTVNSANAENWTAVVAAQFGLDKPCAAQTGLDGDPALGLSVMPPVNHSGCTGYAQGGARVTNPVGIGNKLNGGADASLGFLTVPVVQQIQNHLNTHKGKFDEDDLIVVMAGANDVFYQLGLLQAGATDPDTAMASIVQAANELANDINTKIVGNGGKHVAVLNIPDIAITPMAAYFDAQTRGFVDAMVTTFNNYLQNGLQNSKRVLYVDAYTDSYSQYTNPGAYGLTNVTDTACDLSPDKNFLASSLICTAANLTPGAAGTWMFADRVHPTPYGYGLIANLVISEMQKNGWGWKKEH